VAQPRVRATIRAGHAGVYTPGTIRSADGSRKPHPIHQFKATVKLAAARQFAGPPLRGALTIDVLLLFPRPANLIWKTRPMPRIPHTKKPDRDNCDKAILDALKGIVFADDCQVFNGSITKLIAAGDERPRVEITITT
jgi:Holliday junction resolvase RusA-like endonuclease